MQIKFVRHFESITRNTWCKLKLLDIFCGITAGFAYRRTSEFAFKNARREYEIEFYGHRLTQNGLKPSREKVKALKECGEPTTKEGVRSFLQMVGYMSRFIPNFSQIAARLRALTKHKVQFKWEEEEQVAFRRLKESLKEETSLAYFVPNQPIRVHVDAGKKMESTSNVPGRLCAILTQQHEKGVWRMCNVANRTLTDIETRYGQTNWKL